MGLDIQNGPLGAENRHFKKYIFLLELVQIHVTSLSLALYCARLQNEYSLIQRGVCRTHLRLPRALLILQ